MTTTVDQLAEETASIQSGYVRLPLSAIRHNLVENVDLFIQSDHTAAPQLYRSANYPVSSSDFDELESRGCKSLYVSENNFATIEQELFDSLEEVVANEKI